jgi:hypothetical protein
MDAKTEAPKARGFSMLASPTEINAANLSEPILHKTKTPSISGPPCLSLEKNYAPCEGENINPVAVNICTLFMQ